MILLILIDKTKYSALWFIGTDVLCLATLPQFCLISLDSTHAFILRTFEGQGRKKVVMWWGTIPQKVMTCFQSQNAFHHILSTAGAP